MIENLVKGRFPFEHSPLVEILNPITPVEGILDYVEQLARRSLDFPLSAKSHHFTHFFFIHGDVIFSIHLFPADWCGLYMA